MQYVSFDYSMSSPAMCILSRDGLWKGSLFYFLTDKQKFARLWDADGARVEGQIHKLHSCQEQRFENIATHFITKLACLPERDNVVVGIEDYSMGSKGKVFHIAENTGLLKYLLWKYKFKFQTIPPTTIKKFAAGKGNADKPQMYEAFSTETGCDLSNIMDQKGALASPVTDVVDSYFIARYVRNQYEQIQQGTPKN